jgi:plasmid stabilization system protein ParE
MKIVWRGRARADLFALVAYIARDKKGAAFEMHDRIGRAVDLLALWPGAGRASRKKNVRELVVGGTPYIVLYRHTKNQVTILRVVHGSQRR